MKVIKTPYAKKSLVATKNMLHIKNTAGYSYAFDSRYNFPDEFTISLLVQCNNPGNTNVLLDATQIAFIWTTSDVFGFSIPALGFAGVGWDTSIHLEGGRLYRITLSRSGTDQFIYTNETLTSVGNNNGAALNLSGTANMGAGGFPSNCFLGSVMWFNKSLTQEQVSYLCRNNVPSADLHENVVAHYSLNQIEGATAYDSVEEYNYAKTTPLAALHGTLYGYTSEEKGSANQLTQSIWRNVYTKQIQGEYFLKFNNSNQYAQIPTLTAYTSGTSWILAFVVTKPRDISSFKALFSNQLTAHDNSNALIVALYNNGPYVYAGGGVNNPNVTPNIEYCDKPIVLIVYSNPTESAIVWNGTKYAGTSFTPPSGWEYFVFGRDRDVHYGDPGISKAVFIDHAFTSADIDTLKLMNISNAYKKILGIQFDLDFGQLFTDTVDYFATDTSGNGNHAQLYNFAIDDTEVIRLEGDTLLPPSKALRFTAANSNYLQVKSFAPTDEDGYTYIVGFCLESDRNFSNEYFLAKRKPDNSSAKLLLTGTSRVLGFLNYSPALSISDPGICNNDFTNYDMSKPLYFVGKEYATNSKGLPFGFFEADVAKNPFGWDDALGTDLFIGSDDQIYGGAGFMEGYLFHVSIYKGILSPAEIFNIVNNGLGANPIRINPKCELFLNFDEVAPGNVILDIDGPTSGAIIDYGSPTVTYGTDADGDYCQIVYNGTPGGEKVELSNAYSIRNVDAKFTVKLKVVSATIFCIMGLSYDTHSLVVGSNVLQTLEFIENPSFGYSTYQFQDSFSTVGETIRIYKVFAQEVPTLKDYSPQSRIVQLVNFTDADLTVGDPDYKLVNLNTLR